MRVIRAKLVRKHLRFYKLIFKMEAPYNIILDGNFIFTAIKLKIDIRDRLEKLLQGGAVKLYVLKSVIGELDLVGQKAISAKEFAASLCEVIDDEKIVGETPSDRLTKFLGDSGDVKTIHRRKRYFVATQDKDLRHALALVPGIPLLYLNKVTLVLESPSEASLQFNKETELAKTALNDEESSILNSFSSVGKKRKSSSLDLGDDTVSTSPAASSVVKTVRTKHKAKAPNPLSTAKPMEDSNNTKKKQQKKFRKFY